MDSAYSRHMTGDKSKLSHLSHPRMNDLSHLVIIQEVKLLELKMLTITLHLALKKFYLLMALSISQLCDKDYKVIFDKNEFIITNALNNQILFIAS
jgi:hypothetical protein